MFALFFLQSAAAATGGMAATFTEAR